MVEFINVTENQYIEFLKWYSSAFGGYHYVPVPEYDRTVVYDNQEDMNMIAYRSFGWSIPASIGLLGVEEEKEIVLYHIADNIGKYYTRVTGKELERY